MKILVVEDDLRLQRLMAKSLADQGYEVAATGDGLQGLALAKGHAFDLVLLDWMLPGLSGPEILAELRRTDPKLAIILVTAKDQLADRVTGLDLGADDYIMKPFHVDEFLARVRACVRRGAQTESPTRQLAEVQLDLVRHQVTVTGCKVETTEREFALIELLSRSPGQIFTRSQILATVWGINYNPRTNILDVYVNRLRRKFTDMGGSLNIETIRSVGYRLSCSPS